MIVGHRARVTFELIVQFSDRNRATHAFIPLRGHPVVKLRCRDPMLDLSEKHTA